MNKKYNSQGKSWTLISPQVAGHATLRNYKKKMYQKKLNGSSLVAGQINKQSVFNLVTSDVTISYFDTSLNNGSCLLKKGSHRQGCRSLPVKGYTGQLAGAAYL
ncbi:MAG: hypothetical protein Q8914_09605 [Bacteroidota bacterium]|nr:hypothetical protein [Bacteroidota bacterium]